MAAVLKLTEGKVFHLPLGKIQPDPNQPRKTFDAGALKDLASNIKARGVEHPILVRTGAKGEILIKDGERRWRASQLAKQKTIPAILSPKEDAATTSIDQVALNQHHEKLAPMELARWLVKLRDQHKLTPTEISKRLEKEGMRAMSRSHVANLMRLVELPAWAEKLLNEGKIDTSAARSILSAKHSSRVMDYVKESTANSLHWRGRVTVSEIESAVAHGHQTHHINLKPWNTEALSDERTAKLPHFDYSKVCTGCEHLKVIDKTPFCLNAKLFEEHNAHAKAQGLGVLGKKPKAVGAEKKTNRAPSPAQVKREEERVRIARSDALVDKGRVYLHAWWRRRLREQVREAGNRIKNTVIDFFIIGCPGEDEWVAQRKYERIRDALQHIALKYKHESIARLIEGPKTALYTDVAAALIDTLEWPETRDLAHGFFGKKLADHWKLDAGYLDLLQKAELMQIATANGCFGEGKSDSAIKVTELKALILKLCANLPAPPLLQQVYVEPIERESLAEVLSDRESAFAKCVKCGCTEDNACEGGCHWVETDDGSDLCSACVSQETKMEKKK